MLLDVFLKTKWLSSADCNRVIVVGLVQFGLQKLNAWARCSSSSFPVSKHLQLSELPLRCEEEPWPIPSETSLHVIVVFVCIAPAQGWESIMCHCHETLWNCLWAAFLCCRSLDLERSFLNRHGAALPNTPPESRIGFRVDCGWRIN